MAILPHMVMLATSLILITIHTMGESAQEKQKCAEQLTGIATCLPYLGGSAKAPTIYCCSGLIQAIKNNKKYCICMIVKDRDDPQLGLKINITLALGLPSLCKAPDNLSQCPSLLHLDPKSAEAQAFNQLGHNSNGGSISPFNVYSADGSSQHGTDETVTAKVNGASFKEEKVLQSLVAGVLIWIF